MNALRCFYTEVTLSGADDPIQSMELEINDILHGPTRFRKLCPQVDPALTIMAPSTGTLILEGKKASYLVYDALHRAYDRRHPQ
jgi:hypothetical protein